MQARTNKRMVAVLFIDLDGFKQVNDLHGHKAGDELLKILSKRMLNCLRQTDTVSRMGGDEFVVILGDLSNTDGMLMQTLERIRKAVTEPTHLNGLTLRVTMSIGVAVYSRHGEDSEALLSHADMAMYEAKTSGRNMYRFYTDGDSASVH